MSGLSIANTIATGMVAILLFMLICYSVITIGMLANLLFIRIVATAIINFTLLECGY